jgi:adenosylcobinamide-phosphate synthase
LQTKHSRQALRIMVVTVLSFALLLLIGGMINAFTGAWGESPQAI